MNEWMNDSWGYYIKWYKTRHQRTTTVRSQLHEVSREFKNRDRKSNSDCQKLGRREWRAELLFNGDSFNLGRWNQVLEMDSEHTQCHWTIHLKMVKNGTFCYVNFTLLKKKKKSQRKWNFSANVFLPKILLLVKEKLRSNWLWRFKCALDNSLCS